MDHSLHSKDDSRDENALRRPINSFDSVPIELTEHPSPHHPSGSQRLSFEGPLGTASHPQQHVEDQFLQPPGAGQGLAIENLSESLQSSALDQATSGFGDGAASASDPLISPQTLRQDDDPGADLRRASKHHSSTSSVSSLHQAYQAVPHTVRLVPETPESVTKAFEPQGSRVYNPCRSKSNLYLARSHWLSVSILVLAVYSTVLSALWFIVACVKPRYNWRISHASGAMAPDTASVLAAGLAKSIELSHVTVFVAVLGQILTRTAMFRGSQGITIADLTMRNWVMQPGTMITHFESLVSAGPSILGGITLTVTVMAMLYTTASDALVSPTLKLGGLEQRLILGRVAAQFADPSYVAGLCPTPISKEKDDPEALNSCIQVEHAGQAYHNYMQYLAAWSETRDTTNRSSDLRLRPKPVGMLYDNTTVQGTWINVQNLSGLSREHERTIINVTAAYPHSGVFTAARDPINNILQPQDLSGFGGYNIGASVPSPAVNIMCASVTKDELAPLVYTQWPNATHKPLNASEWPTKHGVPAYPSYVNQTSVDDLFEFGQKYNRIPPVFSRFPAAYNTVLNHSGWYADALYMLSASPRSDYMLCSVSASQTAKCSTYYNASMSGGSMFTTCEDGDDDLRYNTTWPTATEGVRSKDWVNVATQLYLAMSLNSGITDGQSANARILTQLIPETDTLNSSKPSIAEALAVLSGCSLLISSLNTPFVQFWNYTTAIAPTPQEPQYQSFPATFAYSDYASGPNKAWHNIFYVVLFVVFAMNVLCLLFFTIEGGLVTDFAEPQNLFALAINSPQSQQTLGACGGGPTREHFEVKWWIKAENDHVFIDNDDAESTVLPALTPRSDLEFPDTPIMTAYARLSTKRTSIL